MTSNKHKDILLWAVVLFVILAAAAGGMAWQNAQLSASCHTTGKILPAECATYWKVDTSANKADEWASGRTVVRIDGLPYYPKRCDEGYVLTLRDEDPGC